MDNAPVIEAIRLLGGKTSASQKLGVSRQTVYKWLEEPATLTPERACQIEEELRGEVSRVSLRPDIFGPLPYQGGRAV